MLKITVLVLILALIIIQFIPVTKTNPPVTGDFDGPADVKETLRQSCYDCHSNETVWPWYSHIAPVSWLVASDVNEGRHHVNFSEWGGYSALKRAKAAEEIGDEVSAGEMPPSMFLIMHSSAKLDEHDKTVILDWVKQQSGEIPENDDK